MIYWQQLQLWPPAEPEAWMYEPLKADWNTEPPKGGYSWNIFNWSRRWSSCSWFLIYARMVASSWPAVETSYPLAQKCWPVKFLRLPIKSLAMWITLFPLMKPTTCDTAYFGGMEINMWTWSDRRWPSSSSHSFWLARSLNIDPKYFRNSSYIDFFLYFGIHTIWYLHSHNAWLKLQLSFNWNLLPRKIWAVHG